MTNQYTSHIPDDKELKPLIKVFFFSGLKQKGVQQELKSLGIQLSASTLTRRLKEWGLTKNMNYDVQRINDIRKIIEHEIRNMGMNLGYRRMRSLLRVKHGRLVTK